VSDHEAPDLTHLRQLEHLVRHLGEELAMFRRRALQAETKLRGYESSLRSGELFDEQRLVLLERENEELRARLIYATQRAKGVLDQVRFLRQQATRPVAMAHAGNDR
jgi:hypothetical protein